MAAPPTIPRRLPPLLAAAIVAALAVGACTDRSTEPGKVSLDGLLLLTGDLRASTTVVTCVGSPCRMAPVETPKGTTWVAAGDGGQLAATLVDQTLRTSDALHPGGRQSWRKAALVDAEGAAVDGPFLFPSWDPGGVRYAVLAGGLDADPRLVVADPETGTAVEHLLDPPVVPAPPAWLGDDRILIVTGTDDALTSSVVDTTSGDASAGPDGARLVATSRGRADGRGRRTGARPGHRPDHVGLAGGRWLDARQDRPARRDGGGDVAGTRCRRLAAGGRLVTDGGSVRVLAYGRADRWRAVDVTGADQPPAAVVAWSR